jgi:thioredoxin 1
MKNIVELTETNFEPEVLNASGPVVVDFYATWCGPCKMLAPVLGKLAGDLGGRVKFAKADVDEMPDAAARFGITGVPTLMLFRGGRMTDRMVGMPAPAKLKAWLENAANEPAPA